MLMFFATVARIALAALWLLVATGQAEAQSTYSIVLENDTFTGTDQDYTQGLRLNWVSDKEGKSDEAAMLARDWLPVPSNSAMRFGIALGQSIYTPADTSRRDLIREDRPYAAWLYGALTVIAETRKGKMLSTLDTFEVNVGIVGPGALGEPAQNHLHAIKKVPAANGWDNQIKNEPGIVLLYEHKWRNLSSVDGNRGLGVDATPHVVGAVGNVFTYSGAGLAVRFGENLPDDYGPPRIRPALAGSGFFEPEDGDDFGWYLFVGVEERIVARDIFLDGNTLRDSHNVDRKAFVTDLQSGFAIRWLQARLTFSYVIRSEEFSGQDGSHPFGALSFSMRF